MLKIMSCMLLISCSCMLGIMKSYNLKTRCIELENAIETLRMLDIDITYKKEPLAKSFEKISSAKSCYLTEMMRHCSHSLQNQRSLDESWYLAKDRYDPNNYLSDNDMIILDDLFVSLGKSDSEGQHRLFEAAILRLRSNLNEAKNIESKKGKMYISISTAAGIVTSILLL